MAAVSSASGEIEDRTKTTELRESKATRAGKKNFATLIEAHKTKHVLACDEARFGLNTCFKRSWCPKGVRPPWNAEEKYE
jgi:hypothetical protein